MDTRRLARESRCRTPLADRVPGIFFTASDPNTRVGADAHARVDTDAGNEVMQLKILGRR